MLNTPTMPNHPENDYIASSTQEIERVDTSFDDNDVTLLDLDALQSNSDTAQQLSVKDIQKIVAGAHHDLLYTSGNDAYIKIWEELHRVK
jgi:hypothetical protein